MPTPEQKIQTFRGHEIEYLDGEFVYSDDKTSVADNWKDKPCGNCGENVTENGYDSCIGEFCGAMNACCGHGVINDAYIQDWNGDVNRANKPIANYNGKG